MTERKKCYSLVCEICGKPFFYPSPTKKTCGPECERIHASRRRTEWEIKSGHRERLKEERRSQRKPTTPGTGAGRAILSPGARGGNLTPEYWQKFQKHELNYAAAAGKRSITAVNGIDVNAPDFVDLVIISIQESGAARIACGLERKTE